MIDCYLNCLRTCKSQRVTDMSSNWVKDIWDHVSVYLFKEPDTIANNCSGFFLNEASPHFQSCMYKPCLLGISREEISMGWDQECAGHVKDMTNCLYTIWDNKTYTDSDLL